jgi:hypothetical protein
MSVIKPAMDAPDFTKYDESQLRQILSRIDRERFPERVALIETRLSELAEEESPFNRNLGQKNSSRKSVDPSKFAAKPFPGATKKVFGPALPFFVIGAIAIGASVLLDSMSQRSALGIVGPISIIAIFVGVGITYFRLSTLPCPTCQEECKKTILASRNWGAICYRCEIQWDTEISSDD